MFIKSENNELVKKIKKLNDKKERYKNRLFYIEGKNNVIEAINSDFEIVYLIISEGFSGSVDFDEDRIIHVTDTVYRKITDTVTPQMVMAVMKMPYYNADSFIKNDGVYILIDNVQDPGNMGTIIRSADAFNATAIFTLNNSVDIYNPKVVRSTMGSIFHIPVISAGSADNILEKLKEHRIKIFSTDVKAKMFAHQYNIEKGVAFILGNEAKGVSKELDVYIDEYIKIPMTGKAESLNVSIAASIFLYESQRQRLIK